MLHLTGPVYFVYRKDLRRFLTSGLLCNPNSSHLLQTRRTLKNWVPRYILLLREHLQPFSICENEQFQHCVPKFLLQIHRLLHPLLIPTRARFDLFLWLFHLYLMLLLLFLKYTVIGGYSRFCFLFYAL